MNELKKDTGSLLGAESEFEGKLTFLGTVRIEGTFKGEIQSEGTLVIAANANISGKVEVGDLIVTGGHVLADVTAKRSVELHPPGRISGGVTTSSFQIEHGAFFEGKCTMPSKDENENKEILES